MRENEKCGGDDLGLAVSRAARLVMDTLAAEGFGTRPRAWEELWNLAITGVRHARACLVVAEHEYLRWDYEPDSGPETSPAGLAALVMRLLGADGAGVRPPDDRTYRAFLVKGATGRLLEDRGLKVELLCYEDLESFEVVSEIQVTNPARPGRGKARVTDHGDIEWECHVHQAFGTDTAAVVPVIAPAMRAGLDLRPLT